VRRLLIVFGFALPALLLIGWLIAAQLPHWTVPQANWFPPNTPGVCSAVDSLVQYSATRASVGGIGGKEAASRAAQIILAYYSLPVIGDMILVSGDYSALGVEAALPGKPRQGYYVTTEWLSGDRLTKVAVLYLDAQTGKTAALITAVDDPARNCALDVKAALLAAVKSPPLLLLVGYTALVVIGLTTGWLFRRRKTH
jgi:hypothetical protein